MVAVRIMTPGDIETQPIEPYYLQQRRVANADDFGAQIGAATQHFGGVLASLGHQLASKRQPVEDAIGAKRTEMGMNDYYSNSLEEAKKNTAAGAQGFQQNLWGQWEKEAPQKLADLQKQYSLSPDAMKQAQLRDLELRQHYGSQAVTFENNERVRQLTADTGKHIDELQAGAAAHGDFANAQKQVNDIITSASPLMTPEQEQAIRDSSKSGWFGTRNNPGVIERYADSLVGTGFANKQDMLTKWGTFEHEVDSLDMTPNEKLAVKQGIGNDWSRKFLQQFPNEAAQGAAAQAQQQSAQSKTGDTSASIIQHFEGFSPNPYNDVGSLRIGYGSDTITKPDGSVVRVGAGMRVSREDAQRDLERRIPNFQATARNQIGPAWDSLDSNTKAALTSVTYNYGSLPSEVVAAVKSGNKEAIASAVEGLSANKGRRAEEAKIIRDGGADTAVSATPQEGPLKYMSFETWQQAQRGQRAASASLVNDDVSSIESTGQPIIADNNVQSTAATMEPERANQWVEKRAAATAFHQTVSDLQNIASDDGIVSRVQQLQPEAGSPGFAIKQSYYAEAQRQADGIIKLRHSDPATLADQQTESLAPLLANARENKPGAKVALAQGRIAAQAALGIPDAEQQPLTLNEAQSYADRLALVENDPTALSNEAQQLMKEVSSDYGALAPKVAAEILRAHGIDKETAAIGAHIMRKLGSGVVPSQGELQQLDKSGEIDNSEKAANGEQVAKPATSWFDAIGKLGSSQQTNGARRPVPFAQQKPTTGAQQNGGRKLPNQTQLTLLRQNPGLAPQFDAKFGQGASALWTKPDREILNRQPLPDGSVQVDYSDGWTEVYSRDGSVSGFEKGKGRR